MEKDQLEARASFERWAGENFIEYERQSVQRGNGETCRLVFGMFILGPFRVTIGYKTLYEGESFSLAHAAYMAEL
jgi:hypothetical protein